MQNFKIIFLAVYIIIFILSMVFAQNDSADTILIKNRIILENKLNAIIDDVKKNNLLLIALDKAIAQEQESIIQARTLDPPIFNIEFFKSPIANFPNLFKNQEEIDYSIQQALPFPFKIITRINIAKNKKVLSEKIKSITLLNLIKELKTLFYEYYFILRKIEINNENRELVKTYEAIARKQYEVGVGKLSDILRFQTEISIYKNNEFIFNNELSSIKAKINALRNISLETEIGYIPEITPPIFEYTTANLIKLAILHQPSITKINTEINMKKTEITAAKNELLPDFMIKLMYKQMTTMPDDYSFMIGMTIPIAPWSISKYISSVKSANLLVQQAEKEYLNMINMLEVEINNITNRISSNKEKIKTYKETIIPQARQSLMSTLSSYQTGANNFLTILDAHHTLFSVLLEYHMAVMNYMIAISELEYMIGTNLKDVCNIMSNSGER